MFFIAKMSINFIYIIIYDSLHTVHSFGLVFKIVVMLKNEIILLCSFFVPRAADFFTA